MVKVPVGAANPEVTEKLINRVGKISMQNLISTQDLSMHLGDPNWVIVDCRLDLGDIHLGFFSYKEAHIPGAVYSHLDQDLCGEITKTSGRHPLPEADKLRHVLGNMGIDHTKEVVVYDDSGGAFASRLWWTLKYLGHPKAALLDGGFSLWIEEERPVEEGIREAQRVKFLGNPQESWIISLEEVDKSLKEGSLLLIDARASERYRGEIEPLDPVAGHILGAINLPFKHHLDDRGRMLPPEHLMAMYQKELDGREPGEVVLYCGSGVTACLNRLAMEHIGLEGAKVFVGSWSQWCSDPERPVEKGN